MRGTVREITAQFVIGNQATFGYRKVCFRLVLCFFTDEHTKRRMTSVIAVASTTSCLVRCLAFTFETGDECRFRRFDPETKQQARNGILSPDKKKAKTVPSAGKVKTTVFSDSCWSIFCRKEKPSIRIATVS